MQVKKFWGVLVILLLLVMASGCLNSTNQHENSAGYTQTTSAQVPALVLPNSLEFKAVLRVFQNGTLVANYSYTGEVNYTSKSAMIRLSVIYNPENKRLTGNWRYKKILVENGTHIKVFNVPPASWTLVPDNQSAIISREVFSNNPYRFLFRIFESEGVFGTGNLSVELNGNQTSELLSSVMWGDQAPAVRMNGWMLARGGIMVSVHLSGVSGIRRYVFDLEVVG